MENKSSEYEYTEEPKLDDEKTKEDNEIGLIDLFAVLWRRKIMIIIITLFAMISVVAFSIISIRLPSDTSPLPNYYTANAYVLITESRSPAGARQTLLGYGEETYSGLAIFLLRTNSLLDSVIDAFDLVEQYNNNTPHRVVRRGMLRGGLGARFNRNNRVLTIGFTHTDPVLARDIVNITITQLENRFLGLGIDRDRAELERLDLNLTEVFQNILLLEEERRRLEQSIAFIPLAGGGLPAIMADINRTVMASEAMRQVYTQLRFQQEVLRVNIAVEIPMFQILELAEIPSRKSGPSRARLCIIVTFAASFFSVLLAFILEAISNIRKDPVAMAKLRGADA